MAHICSKGAGHTDICESLTERTVAQLRVAPERKKSGRNHERQQNSSIYPPWESFNTSVRVALDDVKLYSGWSDSPPVRDGEQVTP